MWIFNNPSYLLLLALLPPAIWFCHFSKRRGGVFPASNAIWMSDSFKSRNYLLKFILFFSTLMFWLGTAGLITALAGPAFVEKEKIYISRGIDIVFVLDESPSMAAQDFPPTNRFDAAKEVIKNFVSSREHDPVGLVTFAEEAALRIPPTLDYENFKASVDKLELMELGNGTAVGLGVAIAALHMQNSTAKQKAIILITDGESNAGEIVPESAADIAARMGIKIYSIGIGSRGEVPIEYRDRDSGKIITGRYDSDFDEKLLREIADSTGGRYYYAPSTNALGNVVKLIDSQESSEKRVKIKTSSKPGHRILILISFLLILTDFIIRKLFLREVL